MLVYGGILPISILKISGVYSFISENITRLPFYKFYWYSSRAWVFSLITPLTILSLNLASNYSKQALVDIGNIYSASKNKS